MKVLNFRKIQNHFFEDLSYWAQKRIIGLFSFNIFVMLLIVLRSAGYFDPFFPLTINLIVFISLILSVILLGLDSRVMFLIGLIFWIFAAALRIFQVEVWAERTSIYTFQSLLIGVSLLIKESIFKEKTKDAI